MSETKEDLEEAVREYDKLKKEYKTATDTAFSLDKNGRKKYNKYAMRNPLTVTEKEFYHHYWAVANDLISKEEIGVLNSSIGKLNDGEFFNKNADGFYMIPVGEKGIYNKIIFTDGKNNSYSIDTIIEIQLDNETNLSVIRESIYESRSKGIQGEVERLFKTYYGKNYDLNEFRRKSDPDLQNSNGEQDGARSNRETQFSLKDSQGKTLTEKQAEFFKDSKVRDEDGNLLVMYHGSDAYEDFTVFKKGS